MPETVSTETNGKPQPRVVKFYARNYMRVKAVDVTTPEDGVVSILGKNGNGKSSTIDGLMALLTGAGSIAEDPIRHGQSKAVLGADLAIYDVKRVITPKGTPRLELKTKEGLNVPQPQTVLDGLIGKISFDPREFAQLPGPKRRDALMSLVKLDIDLDDLAAKRKAAFDCRTSLKQTHRDFLGELRQTPEPDASLPTEKVDVSALVAEKNARLEVQRANEKTRLVLKEERERATVISNRIKQCQDEIARWQGMLSDAKRDESDCAGTVAELEAAVGKLVDPSTADIDAQISAASDLNTAIDRATQYRERAAKLARMEADIERLSSSIEAFDQAKEDALAKAKFPVAGLSFDDGDVRYNGILFDQIGTANQMRVSTAIAMAMNPTLKLVCVRDASLLDEDSEAAIRQMAAEGGYDLWMEFARGCNNPTIIIEDGAVVGAEEAVEPEAVGVANA